MRLDRLSESAGGPRPSSALVRQARAEQLGATLPPLLVAAERVAATVAQGVHGRRRVGQGDTFWQFRPYQPGDAADQIDWRQSGKSDRVFVRETEWEAVQTVWLWRDGSGSMRYRSRPDLPEKVERAELLLLAMASLLTRAGEHVAMIGEDLLPSGSREMLSRMALLLGDHARPSSALPPPAPIARHARVVLIGDLLAPLPEIDRAFRAIAAKGVRVAVLQVLDPAEETLPFSGRTRFLGLEEEGEALIPRVESVRADYERVLAQHLGGLADICRTLGFTFLSHRTDRPAQSPLLLLYQALAVDPRR